MLSRGQQVASGNSKVNESHFLRICCFQLFLIYFEKVRRLIDVNNSMLADEHIIRFEVIVNKSQTMQLLDCIQKLDANLHHCLHCKPLAKQFLNPVQRITMLVHDNAKLLNSFLFEYLHFLGSISQGHFIATPIPTRYYFEFRTHFNFELFSLIQLVQILKELPLNLCNLPLCC